MNENCSDQFSMFKEQHELVCILVRTLPDNQVLVLTYSIKMV